LGRAGELKQTFARLRYAALLGCQPGQIIAHHAVHRRSVARGDLPNFVQHVLVDTQIDVLHCRPRCHTVYV